MYTYGILHLYYYKINVVLQKLRISPLNINTLKMILLGRPHPQMYPPVALNQYG